MSPLSRAQRIVRIVHAAAQPMPLGEILRELRKRHQGMKDLADVVSTQLAKLAQSGTLKRSGRPRFYVYSPAPGRSPEDSAIRRRAQTPTIVPRKPAAHEAAPARVVCETVQQFLARGGRIQRLPAYGAVPLMRDMSFHAVGKRTMDERKRREREQCDLDETEQEIEA